MKTKVWFSAVALLMIFSMLLTACGPDAATSTPPPAPTTPPATAAPTAAMTGEATATTAAPAAAATDTPGSSSSGSSTAIAHVLRYNEGSEPDELDPQKQSFVGEIGISQLIFDPLMELNEQLQVVPGAAETMTVSPDGLTYNLTLRTGLKYSDGTPLTAQDYDYAFHRLFDPNIPGRQYSSIAYDIVGAEELDSLVVPTDTAKIPAMQAALGVKATDDTHITFTLKHKAAYFPYILTLWVGYPSRKDLVDKGGDQWTTDPNGAYYVGNGPFIMKSYNPPQSMNMVANPNYRLGPPKLQELRAVFITDSSVAFQSYKKGELDTIGVAAEDYATVQNDPTLKSEFSQIQGNCNFYLGFNTTKPPFDKAQVRQAFAQAFNRQDYVDNVLQGLGKAALSFIPPDHPGYAPDIQLYQFDAAKAKQTLSDAGYPGGAGLPDIKLTYSSTPRNQQRMEWVQNQIKTNLGLNLTLDPVESKTYTSLVKDPKTTPQIFFLGWCQDYPDPQDWLSLVFRSDSSVTHIGWKNDQFDQLTSQADVEQDPAKRTDLYLQAQTLLVQEAPAVFLYWDVTPLLIKPYVTGMKEHLSPQDAVVPGFFNILNIDVTP